MASLELVDPSLVVLIGPAGSGKSTLAARLFRPDEILSSDAYRVLVRGDERDQTATGPAFRRLHGDLAVRLRKRRLSVIDATNLTRQARRALLAQARRASIPTAAIVLDLPPAVVHARNGARPRVVDRDVVERHLLALRALVDEGSLAHEGFDLVVVLDDPAQVDALTLVRRPEAGP